MRKSGTISKIGDNTIVGEKYIALLGYLQEHIRKMFSHILFGIDCYIASDR